MNLILFIFFILTFTSQIMAQPDTLTNRVVLSEKFSIDFSDQGRKKSYKQVFTFPGFAVLYRPPAVSFGASIAASQLKVSPRATYHLKKDGPVYAEIDEKGVLLVQGVPRCRLCFNSDCEDTAVAYQHFYADVNAKLPILLNDRSGDLEQTHCPEFYRLNPHKMTYGKGQEATLTRSNSDRDHQDNDGYYYRYTALFHDFDGDYGVIKGAGENGEDIYVKYHPDEHPYLHIMTPHVRFHELMERYNPDFKERFKILADHFEKDEELKKYFVELTAEDKHEPHSELPKEILAKHKETIIEAGPGLHAFLKEFFQGKVSSMYMYYAVAKKDRFELWMRRPFTNTYSLAEIELPSLEAKKLKSTEPFLFLWFEVELETDPESKIGSYYRFGDISIKKEKHSMKGRSIIDSMFGDFVHTHYAY